MSVRTTVAVRVNGRTYERVVESRRLLVDFLRHELHLHGTHVGCEQGVCGACLTRVVSGEPDHRDFFLTPDEQRAGDQMTICCSRARTPRLVLDL